MITRDEPHSRLYINPDYDQISTDWLSPDHWGDRAVAVSSGGRGGAWFVRSDLGDLVLRHYRRGGLVARISERAYIFTGYARARSLAEFQLLMVLKRRGLPVPEPMAAYAGKHGLLWYHAAILIRRIPGAVPLPDSARLRELALWREIGRMIRRFHDEGLDHVDLNCDNILVAGDDVYLIDFDRCHLRGGGSGSAWKQRNLDRLRRSLGKRLTFLDEEHRRTCWQALLSSYTSR